MVDSLIHLVMYLIVVGLIAWLLMWLIDYIPVPPPFNRVARIVIMTIAVLIVCFLLLDLVGGAGPRLVR